VVTFYPGRIPQPSEHVTVQYRGRRRSAARLTASTTGSTAHWIGRVVKPHARNSEDCEHAAQALLQFASDPNVARTGSFTALNSPQTQSEILPGDSLTLGAASLLVRHIVLEDHGAAPEILTRKLAFANDWATGLNLSLSETVPADALIPATAQVLPPGSSAAVLANLQQLVVTATSATMLTIDAGQAPPLGGGFEIRRHDGAFGSGASTNGDLVLQSPVRGFTIPRAAFQEKFFIRMYDASSPSLYSRESAAIVTHLPTS
jgi:hypothetical protein